MAREISRIEGETYDLYNWRYSWRYEPHSTIL